jgi:carbon storage regulator CsrA
MLVLSRKCQEKIFLPTIRTTVQVLEINRGSVRLGIDAPPEIRVLRAEVPDRAAQWEAEPIQPKGCPAGNGKHDSFTRQLHDRLQTTGVALGLLRLHLETGQPEEARATLAALHEDFQLLLHGLKGEMEEPLPPPTTRAPKGQKALLVEDDRNERELLAAFLRQWGLEVDTAGDGADGLDYLRTHAKPDVVLLDMGLPRVDGPTVVREIRSNPAFTGLKVFGVTGFQPEEFDLECGPSGIDRWFLKPLDPTMLLHDLRAELAGARCGV